MGYQKCPNCAQNTAWPAPSGTRCIPCGYGLAPAGTRLRTPEESRKAAAFLRNSVRGERDE